jgi:hypothetical protein
MFWEGRVAVKSEKQRRCEGRAKRRALFASENLHLEEGPELLPRAARG